ncbi:MAG: MBL fold metallo-hydrolase [Desulfarculus sp.]|nr:MBL fold metallo-hydrolase [Desulfarculus sp.]
MGLSFCLLASGSRGNAILVQAGSEAVLVDCGLSGRELFGRLERAGLDHRCVKAIIVTHEHRDHVAGVGVVARKLRLPVLATPATFAACPSLGPVRHLPFRAGEAFHLGGLTIQPFAIPHDAADPVGLVISKGAARLGLATDLGQVLKLVETRLAGCQALILEHNHDPQMLADGPYPPWLKQRVRSRHGHLSNQQGSELLAAVHSRELRQVVLAHLSEKNNTPELAAASARATLDRLESRAGLSVANQDQPSPVLEI